MLLDIIVIVPRVKYFKKYSTFFADTNAGGIGVAHNGNLTNSISLRKN